MLGRSQVLLVEHSRCICSYLHYSVYIRRLILHKVHDTPGSQGRMLFLFSKETTLFIFSTRSRDQVRMNIIRLVSAFEFDLRIRSQNTMGMTVKVTICEVAEPMSWISLSFVSHNNINHRLSRSKYYHRCACEDNCHTHACACGRCSNSQSIPMSRSHLMSNVCHKLIANKLFVGSHKS